MIVSWAKLIMQYKVMEPSFMQNKSVANPRKQWFIFVDQIIYMNVGIRVKSVQVLV